MYIISIKSHLFESSYKCPIQYFIDNTAFRFYNIRFSVKEKYWHVSLLRVLKGRNYDKQTSTDALSQSLSKYAILHTLIHPSKYVCIL